MPNSVVRKYIKDAENVTTAELWKKYPGGLLRHIHKEYVLSPISHDGLAPRFVRTRCSQNLDLRCVLALFVGSQHLWCWGSQPKHVSNPAQKGLPQICSFFRYAEFVMTLYEDPEMVVLVRYVSKVHHSDEVVELSYTFNGVHMTHDVTRDCRDPAAMAWSVAEHLAYKHVAFPAQQHNERRTFGRDDGDLEWEASAVVRRRCPPPPHSPFFCHLFVHMR